MFRQLFSARVLILGAAIGLLGFAWLAALPVRADGEPTPTPTPARATLGMSDPTTWLEPPPPGNSQAERGAFTYWMRCMVCHGDKGQGLAVFRAQYPPQDQNCSQPKCHGGPRPGAGFSFPDAPPIEGPGTLARFKTASDLYGFISTRMPYQVPGTMTSEEYWDLTAYLLKQHNALPASLLLNPANAGTVLVNPAPNHFALLVTGGLAGAVLLGGVFSLLRMRKQSAR